MEPIYKDIFSFYLDEKVYTVRKSVAHILYKKNVGRRIISCLIHIAGQIKSLGKFFRKDAINDSLIHKNWVIVVTSNQLKSVEFLSNYPQEFQFVVNHKTKSLELNVEARYVDFAGILKLRYIFSYLPFVIKVAQSQPRHFLRVFHILFQRIGEFEVMVNVLKKYRPNSIIIANDHGVFYLALMHAAKSLKIPTIYIQHASVSEDFPPLKFDLALLDGLDTLNKYQKNGKVIESKIEMIGVPKFDKFKSLINDKIKVEKIGIPFGLRDSLQDLEEVIKLIKKSFSHLELTIRPHPSDHRLFPKSFNGFGLSNSKTENVYDYLSKQDMIIAADSAIHLEATLLNVKSIYYRYTPLKGEHDIYAFVKNGLVDEAANKKELLAFIQKGIDYKENVRGRAKYYYEPLHTDFDGRCGELAVNKIRKFLEN